VRSSSAIVDEVIREIHWKPVFFLYTRSQRDRIKLALHLDWPSFLSCCRVAAAHHGRRLAISEDKTTGRQIVRGAINAYVTQLAFETRNCMPFENAGRQAAKLHYCLMRWRGFKLRPGNNKAGYVRDLSRAICDSAIPSQDSIARAVETFGSLNHWEQTRLTSAVRREMIDMRKFIEQECGGQFGKAKPLVLGR